MKSTVYDLEIKQTNKKPKKLLINTNTKNEGLPHLYCRKDKKNVYIFKCLQIREEFIRHASYLVSS